MTDIANVQWPEMTIDNVTIKEGYTQARDEFGMGFIAFDEQGKIKTAEYSTSCYNNRPSNERAYNKNIQDFTGILDMVDFAIVAIRGQLTFGFGCVFTTATNILKTHYKHSHKYEGHGDHFASLKEDEVDHFKNALDHYIKALNKPLDEAIRFDDLVDVNNPLYDKSYDTDRFYWMELSEEVRKFYQLGKSDTDDFALEHYYDNSFIKHHDIKEFEMPEVTMADAHMELVDETAKPGINFNTLRIATQVRELSLQGVTLRNTFKAMNEVWLSLHDKDMKCLIVEQIATKTKYQLVQMYAAKLMKYMNSIIGLDMVPLAQQDLTKGTWRQDSILLNIASNRVDNHEHLFVLLLVNLYGLNTDVVSFAMYPSYAKLRNYVLKTYDYDLGDTEGLDPIGDEAVPEDHRVPTLDEAETNLVNYLNVPGIGYRAY